MTRRNTNPRRGKRTKKIRSSDKILIVVEGQTEINYIKSLVEEFKINRKRKRVECIIGGAAKSVLNKARKEQQKEIANNDYNLGYDIVYCVFDKDRDNNFKAVKNEIGKIDNFEAIFSIPCIEFWFLLHYEFCRSGFYAGGISRSPCDECVKKLEKIIKKKYKKPDITNLEELLDEGKIEIAKNWSKEIIKESGKHGGDDPSTRMHELVQKLQKMKKI